MVEPSDPAGEPLVLVSQVSFSWPGQKTLLHLESLRIEPGESVFVAGPSGSGKSTLLSLIGGLIRPSQGEIRVAGVRLSALSGPARDRFRGDRIGLIFQSFNLLPYLSAKDNVTLPAQLSRYRWERARAAFGSVGAAAESLLTSLDLEPELWARAANKLSVGQQQRVAAARALLGRPPLILADEPTSSLDEPRRLAFVELLLRESQKAGSSVLFVSHDESLASRFQSRLALDDLRGSPDQARPR
ncbi:MAG: ABC transporter ATP-binding protein [Deltaproteobacteria bacterium]|jgi:putative ABC transport system ATP-binding protein|nr:ABC transporter ATP-binding protein [Deltaproteobacteria bacterium]